MENFAITCFLNGVFSLGTICLLAKTNTTLEIIFWTVAIMLNILHLRLAYKAMDNHQFNKYAALSLVLLVALTWVNGTSDNIKIRYNHIFWSLYNYFIFKGFWYSWKNKEEWERTKSSDNRKLKEFLDSIPRVKNPYEK